MNESKFNSCDKRQLTFFLLCMCLCACAGGALPLECGIGMCSSHNSLFSGQNFQICARKTPHFSRKPHSLRLYYIGDLCGTYLTIKLECPPLPECVCACGHVLKSDLIHVLKQNLEEKLRGKAEWYHSESDLATQFSELKVNCRDKFACHHCLKINCWDKCACHHCLNVSE